MPGLLPRLERVLRDVSDEVITATQMHRPFNSRHEGYSVILEELDELWTDIKANNHGPDRKEAIQVAAMAIRYVLDFHEPD